MRTAAHNAKTPVHMCRAVCRPCAFRLSSWSKGTDYVYKRGAGRGKESGEDKTRPASKGPPDPILLYDCEHA
jgi:hypothetical protein